MFWNRTPSPSAVNADDAFKSLVFAAMDHLEEVSSQSMTVPEALAQLQSYLHVEAVQGESPTYLLAYHDETIEVRLDAKKAMWLVRSGRLSEPLSYHDPIAGLRLIAWFFDFRNDVLDARYVCAKGWQSWNPENALEDGERYR